MNHKETEYSNAVEFSVRARYALFSDVLTRAGGEKVSYTVPTYESLKGVLHSLYWKPSFIWVVDAVRIMNTIRMARIGVRPLKYGGGNDLAYYTYLKDVHYQVRAHFEWNLNRPELESDRSLAKHSSIARRMIERGGRRDVFLGTRECQADVEPCIFGEGEGDYDNSGIMPLSLMLHGFTYADEAIRQEDKGKMTVRFWQPTVENGIIYFIRPEKCTITRHIKDMEIKPFGKENFIGSSEFSGGGQDGLDE